MSCRYLILFSVITLPFIVTTQAEGDKTSLRHLQFEEESKEESSHRLEDKNGTVTVRDITPEPEPAPEADITSDQIVNGTNTPKVIERPAIPGESLLLMLLMLLGMLVSVFLQCRMKKRKSKEKLRAEVKLDLNPPGEKIRANLDILGAEIRKVISSEDLGLGMAGMHIDEISPKKETRGAFELGDEHEKSIEEHYDIDLPPTNKEGGHILMESGN